MSATSPPPALEIRDLRFHFGDEGGFELTIPSFRLDAGEDLLLTGGSGTGKSTLLQLIAGLLEPVGSADAIRVAGTPIGTLRGAARDRFRGRSIGMIFQTFQLALGFTARENVMLALLFGAPADRNHRARADELLASLGLAPVGGSEADPASDRRDAPVERLSVGQQQRVAVARALACRPPLVLADEPTASLDPDNGRRAIDLIRSTCREQGAALLCVSHDPSLVPLFSRHVDLNTLVTRRSEVGR
jgi:ABC-type lipoprotein export system ATPase subunit